jgi:WD40 repeat protein
MRRPSVAILGLLLGMAIQHAGCGRIGRPASADPHPAVLAPKTVLLRTPDAFGHISFEMSVGFSPDRRTVAAGRMESSGTVVSLCDVASGRERTTIKGPFAESCAVAFSPDGRTLAVGKDRGVTLYDPGTGHERAELASEDAYDCLCLSFSADA